MPRVYIVRETEIFKISTYHNVNIIDLAHCLKSGNICMFSLCESVLFTFVGRARRFPFRR